MNFFCFEPACIKNLYMNYKIFLRLGRKSFPYDFGPLRCVRIRFRPPVSAVTAQLLLCYGTSANIRYPVLAVQAMFVVLFLLMSEMEFFGTMWTFCPVDIVLLPFIWVLERFWSHQGTMKILVFCTAGLLMTAPFAFMM